MKNQNKFYSLALITIITNIIGVLYLGTNQYVSILKIFLLIICIFCVFKICVVCFKWYMEYALNLKTTFDSKVDKPRIFFISLFVPLMIFSLYLISIYKESNSFHGDFSVGNFIMDISYISIFLLLFMLTGYLTYYLFNPSFADLYLPQIQDQLNKEKSKSIISDLNKNELEKIFNGLILKGYLSFEDIVEQNKTKELFIETFVLGVIPEKPIFALEMDYPQLNVLYECFKKRINAFNWGLFLSVFGNTVNFGSLYASVSRAKKKSKSKYYATNHKEIEYFFEN